MKQRALLFLLFLSLLQTSTLFAQKRLKFNVADFHQDQMDLSARNDQFKKTDDSGSLYAIIKVKSDVEDDDLKNFRFDFGYMNSFVELHDDANELWVYVQKNAKTVTISREGYTTINKYNLGVTIASGATYLMSFSVQTPEVQHRILQFKVKCDGEEALVKVKREDTDGDYELWGTTDASGSKARRLETGVYLYEIAADHFDKTEGRIILTGGDGNYVEEVTLRPRFGYLEVADEHGITGAEIYVNDKKIGTVPYTKKDRWDVRDDYRIMISNGELYKTYTSTFAIRKGETTRLAPQLESNFAETTIVVDNNAEIFIEGVSRGKGKFTGPLRAGVYNIECRIDDRYRSTHSQITVKRDQAETFSMPSPEPIVGSLYVSSDPLDAIVQLDGKEIGRTPCELKNILIGQHQLRVIHEGYRVEEPIIEIKEGQTTETEVPLRDFAHFTINSVPQAQLILDGENVGLTPYSFDGASGDFDIQLIRQKHKTFHQKTTLLSSQPERTFTLMRMYQLPTCGYAQVSFHAGSLMGISANVGGYIYNFNVEASYLMGLSKETVYLNYAESTDSKAEELKSTYIGGRIGYGVTVGNRLRITPQVGIGTLQAKSSGISTSALCATIGCRVDYALTPYLGINLTPEGQFALSKKDIFTQLTELSSKINGWGTGVGARVGVYLFI